MKNLVMVCVIGLLMSGKSFAQTGQGFVNEDGMGMQAHSYENGTDVVMVLLDKETGLPVCRLSDEVQMKSQFVKDILPDERTDYIQVNIDELRVCQEENISAAIDEEISLGLALPASLGPNTPLGFAMSHFVPVVAFVAGSLLCDSMEEENNNGPWERFEEVAYFGISWGVITHVIVKYKELFPFITGSSKPARALFVNPVIGSAVTVLGIAACIW